MKASGFSGTERYAIEVQVGMGGMGVVFRARDLEHGEIVALKLLSRTNPQSLYRFKQEFRALADIGHQNLVRLHELCAAGAHWFFTMEFVEGRHMIDYVRGSDEFCERPRTLWDPTVPDDDIDMTLDGLPQAGVPLPGAPQPGERPGGSAPQSPRPEYARAAMLPTVDSPQPSPQLLSMSGSPRGSRSEVGGARPRTSRPRYARPLSDPEQFLRLSEAFVQLVRGLSAIHGAGYVHCDVKNSNVMVTERGRVVVLDYGLVMDSDRAAWLGSRQGERVPGTPLYMAPELLTGGVHTSASDLYALGVMLYTSLVGFAPFVGDHKDVCEQKLVIDPPRLSTWAPALPPPLEALCLDLLQRDPDARPEADEVLERLGARADHDVGSGHVIPELFSDLVGRELELDRLQQLFAEARAARNQIVLLHGSAGIGKSALLSHFSNTVTQHGRAIVLTGRCHERETVPYKALDSLFDALALYLAKQPSIELAPLLPVRIGILARMFPVLQQVAAVRDARAIELQNPRAFRRHAVPVLRELVANVARQAPLILIIDDVHWGDRDSGILLAELLQDPAPPILLILSYRTTEGKVSPFLEALSGVVGRAHELVLEPLAPDDARQLASRVLGDLGSLEVAERIATESGGNAYFVATLAHFLKSHREAVSGLMAQVSLEDVLLNHVDGLPPEAQDLLNIVAVAGEPISQALAQQAARLPPAQAHATIGLLRLHRLVRTRGIRGMDSIETYHDRIRETIWGRLGSEPRTECHRRLAWALVSSDSDDAEMLARHFEGAGDKARAGPCYLQAGHGAAKALAFDRAAEHFSKAIALLQPSGEQATTLRVALADALANAGRGQEAAAAYLDAALIAAPTAAMDYRQRAVALMLDYGMMEEATETLKALLVEHGIPLPTSGKKAIARMLMQRARLRLRGWHFDELSESALAQRVAHRIDALWSVGLGFMLVDTIALSEYNTRALIEALNAGDAMRVARSLSLELAISGMIGRKALAKNRRLVQMARDLSERIDDAYVRGMVALGAGIVSIQVWEHEPARQSFDVACDVLRNQCIGRHAEANRAEMSRVLAYYYLGELQLMRDAVREGVRDAEMHAEWQMATSLRGGTATVAYLVDDDLEGARVAREEMWSRWKHGVGYLRHYWDVYTHLAIDLYAGDWTDIWRHVDERGEVLFHEVLERISLGRMGRSELTARVALAAALANKGEARVRYLREAERLAARLEAERLRPANAMVRLIRACASMLRGQKDAALTELEAAEHALVAVQMKMHAMGARRQRGRLLGGDEGQQLVAESEAWFASKGCVRPARFAEFIVPGGD